MDHSHNTPTATSCCHTPTQNTSEHCHKNGTDWLLWLSVGLTAAAYLAHLFFSDSLKSEALTTFSHATYELMNKMWWGIVFGVVFVGLLSKVPREFVLSILGRGKTTSGILRACAAGVLLDLCSHGILLIGMKLYERGASIGQVMAFLIASPWNSFSLTIIMISLMGIKWTLVFIALSIVLAVISGLIFDACVKRGILPDNPNTIQLPKDFHFLIEAKAHLRATPWGPALLFTLLQSGFRDSLSVLKWLFVGVLLAATIRTFVPTEDFAHYFGPTALGLLLTVIFATITEVCSEGSTPIAADLLTRAAAPGNSFAFLMAGIATDYTEIMVLRETTKSWKIALFLPLVTLPQVIAVSWVLNHFSV